MPAPKKYPDELRQRAVRLVMDSQKDVTARRGACARIGQQLGIPADTIRGWVRTLFGEIHPGEIIAVDVDGEGDDARFTFTGTTKPRIPDALPAGG
jgi:hypothetical protein